MFDRMRNKDGRKSSVDMKDMVELPTSPELITKKRETLVYFTKISCT